MTKPHAPEAERASDAPIGEPAMDAAAAADFDASIEALLPTEADAAHLLDRGARQADIDSFVARTRANPEAMAAVAELHTAMEPPTEPRLRAAAPSERVEAAEARPVAVQGTVTDNAPVEFSKGIDPRHLPTQPRLGQYDPSLGRLAGEPDAAEAPSPHALPPRAPSTAVAPAPDGARRRRTVFAALIGMGAIALVAVGIQLATRLGGSGGRATSSSSSVAPASAGTSAASRTASGTAPMPASAASVSSSTAASPASAESSAPDASSSGADTAPNGSDSTTTQVGSSGRPPVTSRSTGGSSSTRPPGTASQVISSQPPPPSTKTSAPPATSSKPSSSVIIYEN